MYGVYVWRKGEWKEYARFDGTEYEAQVKKAVALKKQDGKAESIRNAAAVMEVFVFGGYFYEKSFGKLVLRALRHFDEVGISNDLHAALEEALDEGAEKFALVKEGTDVAKLTQGVFDVRI